MKKNTLTTVLAVVILILAGILVLFVNEWSRVNGVIERCEDYIGTPCYITALPYSVPNSKIKKFVEGELTKGK